MLWDILWRNKNAFSLSFCLIFSLTGMIWRSNPLMGITGFFGKTADRMSGAINSGVSLPGDVFRRISEYSDLQQKYEKALAQLEENRNNIDKFEALKRENDELRRAMGFAPHKEYPEVKAEILGIRLNSITPRMLINKGRDDGIEPFMPVYTYTTDEHQNLIRTVVGIIAVADGSTSIIQPLQHPDMKLGVRIVSTGQWAIIEGDSDNLRRLKMRYITRDAAPDSTVFKDPMPDVEKSVVITSGEGGLFPAGIPVGQIVQKGEIDEEGGGFLTAYVRPYADLDRLDYVIVMRKKPEVWGPRLDEGGSILDNLSTEFGAPVYPDLPPDKITNKSKTNTPAGPEAPEETPAPTESQPGPGERRLRNLTPPPAGPQGP